MSHVSSKSVKGWSLMLATRLLGLIYNREDADSTLPPKRQ
jgi:hypothetical protein